MHYYQAHIFVCQNQRDKKCCQNAQTDDLYHYLKKQLKNLNLAGRGKIRLTTSGCLGRCAEGPLLVIYPEQLWYTYETIQDIDEILVHYLNHRQSHHPLLLSA